MVVADKEDRQGAVDAAFIQVGGAGRLPVDPLEGGGDGIVGIQAGHAAVDEVVEHVHDDECAVLFHRQSIWKLSISFTRASMMPIFVS